MKKAPLHRRRARTDRTKMFLNSATSKRNENKNRAPFPRPPSSLLLLRRRRRSGRRRPFDQTSLFLSLSQLPRFVFYTVLKFKLSSPLSSLYSLFCLCSLFPFSLLSLFSFSLLFLAPPGALEDDVGPEHELDIVAAAPGGGALHFRSLVEHA